MPAKSLELQHTIQLIRELDAESNEIEAKKGYDEGNPFSHHYHSRHWLSHGAMILNEAWDFSRFDSPDKLLTYAGM